MNVPDREIVEYDPNNELHIPIPNDELVDVLAMNKQKRKNWMRNKPCICKSGKKFKNCCWRKYA